MSQLSPKLSSELAEDVYSIVNGGYTLEIFLARTEFSPEKGTKHQLKATVGTRFIKVEDAFGLCAMGGKGYEKDIFIIFRGSTKLAADWLSNARIGVQTSTSGWPVHIGFNSAFKSMLPQIKTFLEGADIGATIHCIGHSLGGAVATIAANWIANNKPQTVKLYTFGAPKPGLMMFANSATRKIRKKNIFRVYHATDPVPMTPLFPYMHAPLPGFGHFIPSSEAIHTAAAHDITKYAKSVKDLTWNHLERRQPPYTVEHAVKSWLESKSTVHAGSWKIWEWINAGIIYVITKVIGVIAGPVQFGLMGALTVADTLAWILSKGLDFSQKTGLSDLGRWVFLLINKIMQVLGMGIPDETIEMTQVFLRRVLNKLTTRTNEEAKRAIAAI